MVTLGLLPRQEAQCTQHIVNRAAREDSEVRSTSIVMTQGSHFMSSNPNFLSSTIGIMENTSLLDCCGKKG